MGAHAPHMHSQSHTRPEHTGNGLTILLPDKEKTTLCLENAIDTAYIEEISDFLKYRVTADERYTVKS